MKELKIKAYTVNELSQEAREKVLEKYHDINIDNDWYQPIVEGFDEDMAEWGVEAKLRFSGFCSQGDGACFVTDTVDTDLLIRKLHEEFHAIPEDCLHYSKNLSVSVQKVHAAFANRYEHENTITACVYNDSEHIIQSTDCDALESVITAWARRESLTVYRKLEKYYNELTEDIAVIETLEENEYLFTENGNIIPA